MSADYPVLKTYLKEIRETRLLTAEEERELALRIRRGDEAAYQLLIQSNLRFVVNIVKRYRRAGISLMDLIDEGNVGLCRAARRYNPDLGLRFTSYAVWWIRNSLAIYLAKQGGVFSIPVKKISLLYQLESLHQKLYAQLHRTPSPEELAKELEVSAREITDLATAHRSFVSLEKLLNIEDQSRVANILSLNALSPVEKHFSLLAFREHVSRHLTTLKSREREAVELYFGLVNGHAADTFADLGRKLQISREGARLLFHRAMTKLRRAFKEDSVDLWEI